MKASKKLISLLLCLCLSMTVIVIPASTVMAAADGYLKGDCNLFLPESGTVKYKYQLMTSSDGDVVNGATYTITGPAGCGEYAYMDSDTGELYIDASNDAAVEKVLDLSATAAGYTASLKVKVNRGWNIDFENADVVTSLFGSKGSAAIKSDADGNHYGAGYINGWGASSESNYNMVMKPENLSTERLVINLKFRTTGTGAGNGSDNSPLELWYKKIDDKKYAQFSAPTFYTSLNASGDFKNSYFYTNGGSIVVTTDKHASYVVSGYNTLEWVVHRGTASTNNNKSVVTFTLNNTTYSEKRLFSDFDVLLDNAPLDAIRFGSDVDDIEIYTGEKSDYSFEPVRAITISGVDTIYRGAPSTVAQFTMKAMENSAVVDVKAEGFTWAIKETGTGVTIDDNGILKVPGTTNSNFTVELKNGDEVIAEKAVTICKTYYDWSMTVENDRTFLDFEDDEFALGANGQLSSDRMWVLTPYAATNTDGNMAPEHTSVIKVDPHNADNKYLSANGFLRYTATQPTSYIIPRLSSADNAPPKALYGCEEGTISYRAMAESYRLQTVIARNASGNGPYPSAVPWCLITLAEHSGTATRWLDLRYLPISDNVIAIYNYNDAAGNPLDNSTVAGSLTPLAYVPIDTWFDVRIEADFVGKTFDLYINDVLVLDNAKHNAPKIGRMYFGIGFDDIQYYNGTDALASSRTPVTEQFVASSGEAKTAVVPGSGKIALTKDTKNTVTAILSGSEKYKNAEAIYIAVYDNATNEILALKAIGKESFAKPGFAYADIIATPDVEAYAKLFIWDGNLKPIK